MDWGRDNRGIAPAGTTRRVWAENCYNAYGYWRYHDIAKIYPYSVAKAEIEQWDKFLREEYPDAPLDYVAKRYRKWPFWLFFYTFRAECFADRVQRYVENMMKVKSL